MISTGSKRKRWHKRSRQRDVRHNWSSLPSACPARRIQTMRRRSRALPCDNGARGLYNEPEWRRCWAGPNNARRGNDGALCAAGATNRHITGPGSHTRLHRCHLSRPAPAYALRDGPGPRGRPSARAASPHGIPEGNAPTGRHHAMERGHPTARTHAGHGRPRCIPSGASSHTNDWSARTRRPSNWQDV